MIIKTSALKPILGGFAESSHITALVWRRRCSSFLPRPPPSSPFVQQEAPLSSLPAGQRGGQRGHRGAWCCLMAVRTGRAPLQMWCQLLPGVTLERPMAACPPPAHPPHPPISTAGSLLNPPQGEGAGGHTGRYMFPTYRYSLWENTQISEPSRSKASNIYLKE